MSTQHVDMGQELPRELISRIQNPGDKLIMTTTLTDKIKQMDSKEVVYLMLCHRDFLEHNKDLVVLKHNLTVSNKNFTISHKDLVISSKDLVVPNRDLVCLNKDLVVLDSDLVV